MTRPILALLAPELSGGRFVAPPIVIAGLAGVVVVGALVFLGMKLRRALREKR